MKNSQSQSLETYLNQIARELRALPAQARADELREIESHLQTMINARQDVAGVLAQFGQPRKVGRDLRRAWERKQPEAWWRLPLAIAVGIGFTPAVQLVRGFVATGGKFGSLSELYNYPQQAESFNGFYEFGSLAVTFFISGLAMGAISPKYWRWMGWIFCACYFAEVAHLMPPSFFGPLFASMNPTVYYGSFAAISVILSLPCFWGVPIGARLSRKRAAQIADAK